MHKMALYTLHRRKMQLNRCSPVLFFEFLDHELELVPLVSIYGCHHLSGTPRLQEQRGVALHEKVESWVLLDGMHGPSSAFQRRFFSRDLQMDYNFHSTTHHRHRKLPTQRLAVLRNQLVFVFAP